MLVFSITIFSVFAVATSAKILVVVPTPSISHQVVFRPLIQELIARGHELTVITADPVYHSEKTPKNLTEIDVHDMSYFIWDKLLIELSESNQDNNLLYEMTLVFRELSIIFMEQLKNKSVKDLLTDKKVKFDLLILEACVTPALIFSHIFEAPVIQMSSFGTIPGNMHAFGAPTHPFLYPTHYHQKIYNLTMWDKIVELRNHIAFENMLEKQEFKDNIILKSILGNDVPPLNQLKNNVDMLFLNINPIWLHNQPVPPNVIYIWGIHKTPEKKLPKDLQSYLDSSKNGVIYMSFGTNVKTSSIDSKKLEILLKVFSELPYNILWKWDMDELPGKSDNIKILKWLPQCDVLRHPNLKLFITQGGLQSTEEAINAAIPLIGIPMFADQGYNTEKYAHFKIGTELNFESINVENFKAAITDIFTNYKSYKKNIIHLRTQMQDLPKPPLENAIWWTEYVLRHGGARHLRTPAANMSWAEYYELKFILFILSGLIVLMSVLMITLFLCYKYISRTIKIKVS